MRLNNIKNITRFTYATSDFEGFRVSISRKNNKFEKYVSVKKEGGVLKAYNEAKRIRTEALNILDAIPKSRKRLLKREISQVKEAMNITKGGVTKIK